MFLDAVLDLKSEFRWRCKLYLFLYLLYKLYIVFFNTISDFDGVDLFVEHFDVVLKKKSIQDHRNFNKSSLFVAVSYVVLIDFA